MSDFDGWKTNKKIQMGNFFYWNVILCIPDFETSFEFLRLDNAERGML